MKSFVFDVWGQSIPIAEQLCVMAPPNSILVSLTTQGLASKQFSMQPFETSQGIPRIPCFFVSDLALVPPPFEPEVPQTQCQSITGPDTAMENNFGVVQGAGDVVERQFVVEQGFVPVDDFASTASIDTIAAPQSQASDLLISWASPPTKVAATPDLISPRSDLQLASAPEVAKPANEPVEMTCDGSNAGFVPVVE